LVITALAQCAALIAGIVAAIAASLHEPIATALVAFCPCMVLVPGPHLLNGAIDLVRTRIALGIARLSEADQYSDRLLDELGAISRKLYLLRPLGCSRVFSEKSF
jgi:hypothetical protein